MYEAKRLGRNRSVVFQAARTVARTERTGRAEAPPEAYLGCVLALAAALDARDPSTRDHARKVGRYAAAIATRLGLTGDRVELVRVAGLVHDVGQVGVPDAVLLKPGPLGPDEWAEVRRHPEIGARVLAHPVPGEVREWVLRHHERPDGLGYPDGLRGAAIPLEARILAVADAYEAMTSDRPYRRALSPEMARDELVAGVDSQFDARVVEAFVAWLDAGGDDRGASAARAERRVLNTSMFGIEPG
jgi:HD-GYP domain-containing protein (c-di-GMP phosphodiesterase class II)